MLYLLLDRGAKVTLREAALIGDVYLAEELLKQGADPNERDISGRTPLHYAFWAPEGGWRCRVKVAELLLRHGADPNARDNEGKTPLHYAVAHGHSDAVKLLLEYGAEVDEELAEALRLTPLHLAALRGSVEEVERLLNSGADPNVRDVFCRTPLHYAAARNHKTAAELLLKHGADPNARNNEGKTPLDLVNCPKMARAFRGLFSGARR